MFRLNLDAFEEWEPEELLMEAEKNKWTSDDTWANIISWQLEQFVHDNGGGDKWYSFNGRTSYGQKDAPNILVDLRDCNDGEQWDSAKKRWKEDGHDENEIKRLSDGQALGSLHALENIVEREGSSDGFPNKKSVVIIWPYHALGDWHESDISLPTMSRIYGHRSCEIAIYIEMSYED